MLLLLMFYSSIVVDINVVDGDVTFGQASNNSIREIQRSEEIRSRAFLEQFRIVGLNANQRNRQHWQTSDSALRHLAYEVFDSMIG